MVTSALAVIHLGLLAVWLGAMLYSLVIVQPRAARFFTDDDTHEEFLTVLGAGNRTPVLAILVAVVGTGIPLAATGELSTAAGWLLGVEGVLVVAAAAVFTRVSWRLWPRRVFALPSERPAHRTQLRRHALLMVALVGTAFVLAVVAVTNPA
ncbi:hypothetical protein [Phytoactinopolyspora limicola]|uniref:hypothetical protein n=1 Tax=Phytoactinopolyspora limicola TaxID=2715536 RepID=UPI00140E5C3B|nr:hypothetical protein [Phytoactinopolyspora limicola]